VDAGCRREGRRRKRRIPGRDPCKAAGRGWGDVIRKVEPRPVPGSPRVPGEEARSPRSKEAGGFGCIHADALIGNGDFNGGGKMLG